MGSYGQLSYTCVEDLNFRVYTDEEIRKISVVRITNDLSINELGHFSPDGLYDLRMGPMSVRERDQCQTCRQESNRCQGHCGHIDLPLPLYNPFFYDVLKKIVGKICWTCFRYQAKPHQAMLLVHQVQLLKEGYGQEALEMEEIASRIISGAGGEADEVQVGLDDKDIKGSEKGYPQMVMMKRLDKELRSFYKKVVAGGTSSPDTSTSNVKAVHQHVLRHFYNESQAKLSCHFCNIRRLRLTLQNSRFMVINKSASVIKKQNVKETKPATPQKPKNKSKPKQKWSESVFSDEDESDGYDEAEDKNIDEEEDSPEKVEEEKEERSEKNAEGSDDDTEPKEEEETMKASKSNIVSDSQSYVTPEQVRNALRKVWLKDSELLKHLYPILGCSEWENPTDMFFLHTLLVIPPKYRPCDFQNGMTVEHETSTLLKNVVKLSKCLTFLMSLVNGTIKEIPETLNYIISEIPGKNPLEKSQTVWFQMQGNVDNIFDADLNRLARTTTKGIRQVIEKKNGLFRRNLMGKRVNYSARSVAAPDPLLAVDEVGVPMDFAIRLSYPVPVTQWNVEELRQLVINGAHEYPGALMVEDEEGSKKRLITLDKNQRIAIAKQLLTPKESHVRKVNATKIVYRHLQNGDLVLMNRQPTLHRPSIQAHRSRIMPKDRVLRMPYANCKAYNADFDGDELNMHFPQNELARSESHHLITTKNQYLTPKDGSPLAGLIQDCVVSSVMLTMRGTFFCKEDYQQLLYSALAEETRKIEILPPSVLKPKMLWSGKQVISSLLHNIIPKTKARPSFSFRTSVKVDLWQTSEPRTWKAGGKPEKRKECMTESDFVMRDGELLAGVIDKSAIGSTSHGLVHVCYDLYGGSVATKVLTAINRLCVYYLQWSGHTISVKEFVTSKSLSKKRRESLAELVKKTPSKVSQRLHITENDFRDYFENSHMSGNEKDMAAIDAAYTAALGPTTSEITGENEKGLLRCSLDNHMRMMVDTGAKGSKVNMNQMASLFGSVAIDGKRMPISITGKFLPSFKPYEANPRAGGYIPHRFMTGMDPQAYFYLCIVGRDSLQHTAVKTANSGYLQRCLIKHLEGIQVKYDMTVRNSDGLVLQFDYGEDGQDVTKVPFLKNSSTMNVLVENYSRLLEDRSLTIAKSVGDKEEVDCYTKKLKKWQKKYGKESSGRRSGFLKFCKKMSKTIEATGYCSDTGRPNSYKVLQEMWAELSEEEKLKYEKVGANCPDPVNSVFSGAANLGVVSEALEQLIDDYYENHYSKKPVQEQKLTYEEVATTVHMKALTSKVDPGEAVGALCAQAIGEPLTQMTLNTFHFAGRDELNVTLGVPRMVEILRTAGKNISTPIMEVPFHKNITKAYATALQIKLTEVPLAKVLHGLDVSVQLERDGKNRIHRSTKVKFTFLPHKQYKHVCAVNPSRVLQYMERQFIPKIMLKEIHKSFMKKKSACSTALDQKRAERKTRDEEDSGEVDEDEDSILATREAEKQQGVAEESSGDEDEDEPEVGADDGTLASRNTKAKEQDYSEDEGEEGSREQSEDEAEPDKEEVTEEDLRPVDVKTPKKKKGTAISESTVRFRKSIVADADAWIVDYSFDTEEELWCEVTLLLPLAGGNYDIPSIVRQKSQRCLIHSVPGIKRVFVVEKDDGLLLRTEGVNVFKMFEYEHLLDVNRLYTNNIHQVAEMYGIEAAQRSIIRELRAVQSAYDIKVDFRHLTLLADYFTCEGVYKACSRQALATCVSPLQKMSYETCTAFLKSALLQGEKDRMLSPSANIAVGQPVKVGTNVMHVLPLIKL